MTVKKDIYVMDRSNPQGGFKYLCSTDVKNRESNRKEVERIERDRLANNIQYKASSAPISNALYCNGCIYMPAGTNKVFFNDKYKFKIERAK